MSLRESNSASMRSCVSASLRACVSASLCQCVKTSALPERDGRNLAGDPVLKNIPDGDGLFFQMHGLDDALEEAESAAVQGYGFAQPVVVHLAQVETPI